MIPKVDNPESANHFCPISLCSTIHKIISKILTSLLQEFLGSIIHPLQGAFVLERLIQDNILIAHEVFHSLKNKGGKEGWIALKLDMKKAYDRLEWDYIIMTLETLGFHPTWVQWIKSCISSVSFSALVKDFMGLDFFLLGIFVKVTCYLLIYLFSMQSFWLGKFIIRVSLTLSCLVFN